MPLDDYSSAGGGALRLKGAKVTKKKKKKDKGSSLEKALSGGDTTVAKTDQDAAEGMSDGEIARKRRDEEEKARPLPKKTEAERVIEQLKRKRFLEMAENPESRPELLKTHKDRVEELNSFLSKLSEHNDMPKIGPG
ncbi:uncharacterized protein DNG_02030 [Cephalotrichum gorgonifer]|uniref:DUF1754-domain-containing protein n=1 Tax=Cephalotrichum gorgonifer TaxID=2041049 RepID=A0AAE8MSM5_9PEZI|nr:uncharacterized protein DNG_02030 [Cephalotrichum gorgonifer]